MLTKSRIISLFRSLDKELENIGVAGELFLVGGAVMCLSFDARASTQEIDALSLPKTGIQKLANKIAQREGIEEDWLNDAVKGFLRERADFKQYLELTSLKVYTAQPEYLLAMKCLSMRIGEEFHDEDDVRFLLRYLNIETLEKAISIIIDYYPREKFPQKTFYALEELLK